MNPLGTVILTLAVALLSGCAAPPITQLNEPSRSAASLDVANLLRPRDIPYESQEQQGLAVSYNLFFARSPSFSGYRLTLIVRNNTPERQTFEPSITLQDAAGFLIQSYSFFAFVSEASSLAGTVVPPMPETPRPYETRGTVTSAATGRTYNYSSTTNEANGGIAGGFARGLAQGAAIRAAHAQEEGRLMLRWANSFWLRRAYELPPGAAVSGAIFFPAAQLGKQPLTLRIKGSGRIYLFESAGPGA